MAKRKQISKKVRFDIFKRDSFTCQYCGKKAPDVILHVDHIEPVCKGGDNSYSNLVTACVDCNLGKGAKKLNDNEAMEKHRIELESLQQRKEQLEMMYEWQKSLNNLDKQELDMIAQLWEDLTETYSLSETGYDSLKKYIKRYGVSDVMEAMNESCHRYLKIGTGGKYTQDSVESTWKKIGLICYEKQNPVEGASKYIRGILNNKQTIPFSMFREVEEMVIDKYSEGDYTLEKLKSIAINSDNVYDFAEKIGAKI